MSAVAVVDRWARATEERLRRVLVSAGQDVAENVSVGGAYSPGTPVDTGFAVNNWDATLGTPDAAPIRNESGATVTSGSTASMNVTIASADITDVITIYNNTEYLPYLEDGSTQPKAPNTAGWIAQTITAWPLIVSAAVAKVRGR